jgi:hypothetical protein
LARRMRSRASQLMESKALRKSNLKTAAGVARLWQLCTMSAA